MTFGPLEFAAYLGRKGAKKSESATVRAARSAAPVSLPQKARLTVVSRSSVPSSVSRLAQVDAVSVFEAVAMRAPCAPQKYGPVKVLVRTSLRPVVLVLSSHQTVNWELAIDPGAELKAVLLSGYGESTVAGAGNALVSSIGGFYAFKRGSTEFKHLEQEVLRCTGRGIERFQSVYAGHSFEINGD